MPTQKFNREFKNQVMPNTTKKEDRARKMVSKGMTVYMGGSHAARKGQETKGKAMKYVGKKMIDTGGKRLKKAGK